VSLRDNRGLHSCDSFNRLVHGRIVRNIAAEMNVLAIATKLATRLHVKTADLVGVDAARSGSGRTHDLFEKLRSGEAAERVGLGAFGSHDHNVALALVEPCGACITVGCAAVAACGGLSTELVDVVTIDVNLMALGTNVASLALEQQTQGEVLEWLPLEKVFRPLRWGDERCGDNNLARSIARVNDGNRSSGRKHR